MIGAFLIVAVLMSLVGLACVMVEEEERAARPWSAELERDRQENPEDWRRIYEERDRRQQEQAQREYEESIRKLKS